MAKALLDMLFDELLDRIFGSVSDSEWTGRHGERLTKRKLQFAKFSGRDGEILCNAYIPKPDGTTSEIDLLFITEKGIFVIESKNYSGWIFGSEEQFKWTASLPGGHKEHFYNPIKQNRSHIKWLANYLGENTPFFSLIVFSERCELKKVSTNSTDVWVVKRDSLNATIRSIWNKTPSVMDKESIGRIYSRILPLTDKTKAEKAAHVESIKKCEFKSPERAAEPSYKPAEKIKGPRSDQYEPANVPPASGCPICGSPMVLRTARRGVRAGKKFWGCSSYPKCRGIVNID